MKSQFAHPQIGSKVAITFEFPSYVIGSLKVNKTTITGIVEKATKFTQPDAIRLTTDFDSPVRTREIPLHRVVDIKYADGRNSTRTLVNDDTKSWTIEGSRGSKYIVLSKNNSWTCTCPGFQFRRMCKHVQQFNNI
jgi:plasmid maintenance system antidote protein VapI